MAKVDKNSFLLHHGFKETFEALGPDQAGRLILEVFEYEETQREPELSGELNIAWIQVRQWLDNQRNKYEETCKARQKAGEKGGRPPKQKVKDESKKTKRIFDKPKKPDNDFDNDSESDNDSIKDSNPPIGGSESEPHITHQDVFEYYMQKGLVKHKAFTPEMRSAMDTARRRCNYTFEDMKLLISRHALIVEASKNDGEFKVDRRSLTEFFGQRVHGGTALICSEYADDGKKWPRYLSGGYGQKNQVRSLGGETARYAGERSELGDFDSITMDLFTDLVEIAGDCDSCENFRRCRKRDAPKHRPQQKYLNEHGICENFIPRSATTVSG